MDRFATLLDSLVTTQSRNGKLALLVGYFRAAPDPDRGWALAALTDGLPLRISLRRVLTELMAARVDPVLYKMSRDYVGDTAETVALLWPDDAHRSAAPRLDTLVGDFTACPPGAIAQRVAQTLDALDNRGRWAFLKLIGGAPRAGVSARLAKVALAEMSGRDVADIEEVWHALAPPYAELFAWLDSRGPKPDAGGKAVYRPVMLANAIDDNDWARLRPGDFLAEWKWDGIRIQIAANGPEVRIFSRAGDDISAAFPDLRSSFDGAHMIADGELLVARGGVVAPFNDLQQRLNRKTVSARMLRDYPAHVRLYDLLFEGSVDLRAMPLLDRRARLLDWHAAHRPPRSDVSDLVPFATFAELEHLWSSAREAGIEGLMLKRKDSPYLAGRPKAYWFKWKRAAQTLDCVLMYAQRGSGKRSSYYSDYTFGVWRRSDAGGRELVPVGKAYSGFTDEELKSLDRFIRANTIETFGPVRSVKPDLVFEVAFDAVQPSSRHKSGIAMRFPRIARIRWDKPAAEADTIETAMSLVPKAVATAASI